MIRVSEVQVKSYVSPSGLPAADFVVNPYVGCPHKCIYCYAEFMKRFTGHQEAWGDFIDVKRCPKLIDMQKIGDSKVLFGSATDAYNPYERKYGVTRGLLEQMTKSDARVEILTKSALVTRDIDVLKRIPHLRVGISMNTLDDRFRRDTEPYAAPVGKRLDALAALHAAGIDTYLFASPIFPGITDVIALIDAARPHVNAFYFENLNLRGGYRPRVLGYIAERHPALVPLYDRIYGSKDNAYWEELSGRIRLYCEAENLPFGLFFYHSDIKKGGKDYRKD